jgi:hypothetical protein
MDGWLLYQVPDEELAIMRAGAGHDAVHPDQRGRDLLHGNYGAVVEREEIYQLFCTRWNGYGIAKKNRKGFIINEGFRMTDSISKSPHLMLPYKENSQIVEHAIKGLEIGILASFVTTIEIIFDGSLPPASDNENLTNSCFPGLFHHILDNRHVNDRKHLFGH